MWSTERGGGGARQISANSSVSCAGGCEARGRVDGYCFNRAESERLRVVGRLETAAGILFFLVERQLRLPTKKKCHRDWERRDARMGSGSPGQVILAGEGKCECHGKKTLSPRGSPRRGLFFFKSTRANKIKSGRLGGSASKGRASESPRLRSSTQLFHSTDHPTSPQLPRPKSGANNCTGLLGLL